MLMGLQQALRWGGFVFLFFVVAAATSNRSSAMK